MVDVAVATVTGVSVWTAVRPAAQPAASARWLGDLAPTQGAASATVGGGEDAFLTRWRGPLSVLAGVGAWLFVGSSLGVPAGLAAGVAAWVILGRTESPAARRRRERLDRDLPVAVGLLASCLASGTDIDSALVLVGEAVGGPIEELFLGVHHRLIIGESPTAVWREVAAQPRLGGLGRALLRSHESGASVAAAVGRLATDLADANRSEVEALARRVGVRAALPLGICFLPSFLVLGVLPMAVGLLRSLPLFG